MKVNSIKFILRIKFLPGVSGRGKQRQEDSKKRQRRFVYTIEGVLITSKSSADRQG